MFSSEIKVEGQFVKGKIKQQEPKTGSELMTTQPYGFVTNMSGMTGRLVSSEELREHAAEMIRVANEIDKLNNKGTRLEMNIGIPVGMNPTRGSL